MFCLSLIWGTLVRLINKKVEDIVHRARPTPTFSPHWP